MYMELIVVVGNMAVVLGLGDAMCMVDVDLESVYSPNGVLTPKEGTFNVFFLFL